MKKNKLILKLVQKLAIQSFDSKGKLNQANIRLFSSQLKKLSTPLAIYALSRYIKQIRNILKDFTLEIESESGLTKSQVDILIKSFKLNHKIFQVKVLENSKLLAGVKVKIGDFVYDYSVLDRINQLRSKING